MVFIIRCEKRANFFNSLIKNGPFLKWKISNRFRMKYFHALYLFLFLVGLCACSQKEDEMDYDDLVKEEESEEEWVSLNNIEGRDIAFDLLPCPQEIFIPE